MTTIRPDQDVREDLALESILRRRFSCRAFGPDPVHPETVERLLSLAQRSASWCNAQPWQVTLLTGAATQEFARALGDHVRRGERAADLGLPLAYEGEYATRRRDAGRALYDAVGVPPGDREARATQSARNFSFFGAPNVAIITTPSALGTYGAVDCGAYVAVFTLVAQSLGLGAIALGSVAMYSDFVREYLHIADDRLVVCAVAFGEADLTHPANQFRTTRATVATVVEQHEESS